MEWWQPWSLLRPAPLWAAPPAPVVLITGCSAGGLGHALAARFAAAGARVFAAARRPESMSALPPGVTRLALDVTDDAQCAAAVASLTAATGGRLDVLVNNAGVAQPGPLAESPLSELRAAVATNLVAPVCLIQAALPHMAAGGGGLVINISSIYAHVISPFNGAYCASKHGLRVISGTLRLELAPYNIAVMDAALGFTATSLLAKGIDCMAAAGARAGSGCASRLGPALAAAARAQAAIVARAAAVDAVADPIVAAALARRGPPGSLMVGTGAWLAWLASCAPTAVVQGAYGLALGLLPWRLPAPLAAAAAALGLSGPGCGRSEVVASVSIGGRAGGGSCGGKRSAVRSGSVARRAGASGALTALLA